MDPQAEGTIAILEQELDKLQTDYNDLFFAREMDEIEHAHELAWWMEWNRNLDQQGAFLEAEIDAIKLERDHELAYWINHMLDQDKFLKKLLPVLFKYIDHFDKHPLNYMSEELKSITASAKSVVGR